jgi:hypothetical protein
MWNARNLFSPRPLTTVATELTRYRLDLVGVQDVRLDKVGTLGAEDYTSLRIE